MLENKILLKSERAFCLYCNHRWFVIFATKEDELSRFISGWRNYRDVQEKIRMHKLLCERDYLAKKYALKKEVENARR